MYLIIKRLDIKGCTYKWVIESRPENVPSGINEILFPCNELKKYNLIKKKTIYLQNYEVNTYMILNDLRPASEFFSRHCNLLYPNSLKNWYKCYNIHITLKMIFFSLLTEWIVWITVKTCCLIKLLNGYYLNP